MRFRPATRRRVVGCLLLLMITYGATVEAAHSHGSVAPARSSFAAVIDVGGSLPDTNHSQHRECVMCQFQQQLFNGIVHAPLFILVPATRIAFVPTPTVLSPSSPTSRPSGRAPPLGGR
ncbi:MAG: hypothetical protein ACJ741_02455 [Pyrinomonadaceae bacterium]